MLEAAISGAQHLFSPGPIIGMLLVLPLSLISGLIPGEDCRLRLWFFHL